MNYHPTFGIRNLILENCDERALRESRRRFPIFPLDSFVPVKSQFVMQPSGKTKVRVLYYSAIQKLLGEVGLSLLDAANKSEWHNITRPEALPVQARAASGSSDQVAAKRPSAVTKVAASSTSRAAGASVTASATCKPESRRNLQPEEAHQTCNSNLGCGP